MSHMTVVPYAKEHLPAVIELWKEQYSADDVQTRTILFQWFTEQNPFLSGRAPYFVLIDGERVVGLHGFMPLRFRVNGVTRMGRLAQDALLAKECRGKGLGKVFLEQITTLAPGFAGALWFNEPNHKMYIKAGWTDVTGLTAMIRIYDPSDLLRSRIKNSALLGIASALGRAALWLRHLATPRGNSPGVRVASIDRFTDAFDALYDRVAPQLGISVERTKDYLNWRFCDKPFSAYRRLAATDEHGGLLGYLVSKTVRDSSGAAGEIVDVLFLPDRPDVLAALVGAALREFEAVRASSVKILCSSSRATRVLSRMGFIRARRDDYFMVTNVGELGDVPATEISGWYITLSDADGDAWTVHPS